jgi:hypothetical protein
MDRKVFFIFVLVILGMGVGMFIGDSRGILFGVCEIIKQISMFVLCLLVGYLFDWQLKGKSYLFLYLSVGEKSLSDKINEYLIQTMDKYNNAVNLGYELNRVEKAISGCSAESSVIIQWTNINARNKFSFGMLLDFIFLENGSSRNKFVEEYINDIIVKTCRGEI